MRKILIAVGVFISTGTNALQFPSTCRGPTATVTNIEGLDTPKARLTAQYTMPDAIAYCYYSLRNPSQNPDGKKPKPAAVQVCAKEFLGTEGKKSLSAEANCKVGVIGIPTLKANAQKLPLLTDCADGGTQASDLFQTLCPTYEGKIKDE